MRRCGLARPADLALRQMAAMPYSVRNPRLGSEAGATRRQRGFTLLELLVVLALVGLVTAVAVPNLERLYAAVTRSAERDHILDQFAGLGRRALHQGRNFVVFGAGDGREGDLADAIQRWMDAAPAGTEGAARNFAELLHGGWEAYALDVPEGWEVRLAPPLLVRANGVCLGAGLTLYYRGEAESPIALEPPWCRVEPGA